MWNRTRLIGGTFLVLLLGFSVCSKREEPTEVAPALSGAAKWRAALAGSAVEPGKSEVSDGVEKSASARAEASAKGEAAENRTVADARRTAQMELERSPLDLQRLLEGIWEKYELDELETPEVLRKELLDRFYAGDLSVATDLGILIAYGDPSEDEPALAKEILEEAAADGDARALSELGRLFLSGRGVEQDGQAAQSYFERAKEAGDLDGTFLLGMGHRIGLWKDADAESGLVLLETAASLGHVVAANSLFRISEDGSDGTLEERLAAYPELENWLSAGVDRGDIQSMLNLSDYYKELGEPAKQVPLLKAAAELGSFDALGNLMDLSWSQFKSEAYRDSFKELLLPHAEMGTASAGQAYYRLAALEAMSGPSRLAEMESLLLEAKANGSLSADSVLQKLEDGVSPFLAFIATSKLSREELYVEKLNRIGVKVGEDSRQWNSYFSNWTSGIQEAYGEWVESQGLVSEGEDSAVVQPQEPERDRSLKIKKMGSVKYPAELQADSISGEVLVELTIGTNGRVERSRVVESSHLGFEASALEAAADIEFEPKIKNGKPVRFMVRLPMVFSP